MLTADLISTASTLVVRLVVRLGDPTPEPEDVKAGWAAFALFGLLILAVVVLGLSLTKRLRNVERAEAQGLYDPSTKKPRTTLPAAPDPAQPQPPEDPRQQPPAE